MKRDIYDLPESLYDFTQIPDYRGTIEELANLVEAEDWNRFATQYPLVRVSLLDK